MKLDHYLIPQITSSGLFFFSFIFFIVVQLQLSAFSPHPSAPPSPNPPPSPTSTLPLGFVHVSFIVVPGSPSPHSPPPHSPLAIVRLFLTSMSLVIFCLLFSFVDYVPVKGEIIWYQSLTAWLISLSICKKNLIQGHKDQYFIFRDFKTLKIKY